MDIKKLILLYFTVFTSCIGGKDHLFQKNILNDHYKLIIANLCKDLEYDTTNIKFNDIDYISFMSLESNFELNMYIGRHDPPAHWKSTFKFDLSVDELRDEVESFKGNYFIESNIYYFKGRSIKSVTYIQDDQLLKIESRFEIKPDLIVNSIFIKNIRDNSEIDLMYCNKRFLQGIDVVKIN